MLNQTLRQLLLFTLLLLNSACTLAPQPAPLVAFLGRAKTLLRERRYSEAVLRLEEAAQAYPQHPLPLIKLGQIYLIQHRWLLAEDAFNRALAREGRQPLATAGLAEALLNQDRLAEALASWQETVTINPRLRGAFTGLGRTQLRLFDFTAAQAAFLTQQTYYFDPEAQWYLAALTAPLDLVTATGYLNAINLPADPLQEGEPPPADAVPPEEAVQPELLAWRDYLLATLAPFTAQSPTAEVAKATGVALAQVHMWPLAVHALTIANEEQPGDVETLAFLGYALAQAGRPALDILEQAQRADPQSALPLYFQGLYLRQKEALQAAEALFSQAVALDPDNAAFYVELAQTKAQQGNFAAAEIYYQAAIETAPDEVQFQLLLAQFYTDRGYRLVEAGIPTVEAIIEADKNNATAYDLLGWMQFLSGAAGEEAIRQALKLDPDLISARYHLARQLEAKGQTHLAIEEYQRVIDWDTSGSFRDRALKDLQQLQ